MADLTAAVTDLGHAADPRSRYSDRLCNDDLAPLADQHWGAYNIFAFRMSDVHSVGGCVFAGSLFALGLASWQVLIALLAGIVFVNVFANLIAKSSQRHGVPCPVICRATFGVLGANVPARDPRADPGRRARDRVRVRAGALVYVVASRRS